MLPQVMPSIISGNWQRLSKGKYVVVAVSHPSDVDAERSLLWLGDVAIEFERAKYDTPSYEVLQFAHLNGHEWAAFAGRFTTSNGKNGVEVFITDTKNAGSISVPAANISDAASISRFLKLVVSGDVTFKVGCVLSKAELFLSCARQIFQTYFPRCPRSPSNHALRCSLVALFDQSRIRWMDWISKTVSSSSSIASFLTVAVVAFFIFRSESTLMKHCKGWVVGFTWHQVQLRKTSACYPFYHVLCVSEN